MISRQNVVLVKIPFIFGCISTPTQEHLTVFVMETHRVHCAVRNNIVGITTTGLSIATQCQATTTRDCCWQMVNNYIVLTGSLSLQASSQNCEKRLLSSSFLYVRPSVRMDQHGSHWKDFHEIRCLSTFGQSVDKIQVSLKSDQNNAYFT
jgi:hypothetical protein